MGRPNYPCYKLPVPYFRYAAPVTTTTTPPPEDVDFFVLPNPNAVCPEPENTYTFVPKYKILGNLYVKVSDIIIQSVGCEPYYLSLTGAHKDFFDINGDDLYFNYADALTQSYYVTVNINSMIGTIIASKNFTLNVNVLPCPTTTNTTSTTLQPGYYCATLNTGYYCTEIAEGYYCVEGSDGYYCVETDEGYYCVEYDPYFCVRPITASTTTLSP